MSRGCDELYFHLIISNGGGGVDFIFLKYNYITRFSVDYKIIPTSAVDIV